MCAKQFQIFMEIMFSRLKYPLVFQLFQILQKSCIWIVHPCRLSLVMYDQQQGMQSFSTGYVFPDRLEQQSKMREPVGDDFFFNRDHGSSGSFLRKPQPLCRMVGYNVTHLNCLPCFPQQQSQTPPLPLIDRDIQPGRRTSCGDFLSAESTFRFPPQMQNANNVVPGSLELNQGVTLGHRALSFVRGDPPMEQASKQADDQMADFKVTCFVHEQDGSDLRQTWCQPSDQVITNLPSSGPAQASRHHCLGPAPKRTYPYSTTTFESGRESNRPAHHISTSGRRRELAPKKDRRHMIPKRTAQAVLSNVVSQRKSHIWSERQRRRSMNQLYTTMRALLPHQSVKVRLQLLAPLTSWLLGFQDIEVNQKSMRSSLELYSVSNLELAHGLMTECGAFSLWVADRQVHRCFGHRKLHPNSASGAGNALEATRPTGYDTQLAPEIFPSVFSPWPHLCGSHEWCLCTDGCDHLTSAGQRFLPGLFPGQQRGHPYLRSPPLCHHHCSCPAMPPNTHHCDSR